jgi:hypothetical protein
MNLPVTRWIRAYSNKTDELVFERQVALDWTLAQLQELVAEPSDNPLFDCWPLNIHQLTALATDLAAQHSHEDLSFFLEADSDT